MRNMLTHKCDIYHLQDVTASLGYGLPATPQKSYPETPSKANVNCYFTQQTSTTSQKKPAIEISDVVTVIFDKSTDIRLGDKIFNRQNGRVYRASQPELIKDHHYEIIAVMEELV